MTNDQLNIAEMPELPPIPRGDRFEDVRAFRHIGVGTGSDLYECWNDAIHKYATDYALAAQAPLVERIKELEKQNAELRSAMQALVDMYVANQGSDHEHICCITPPGMFGMTPAQRKQSKTWAAWDRARAALASSQGEQKGGV